MPDETTRVERTWIYSRSTLWTLGIIFPVTLATVVGRLVVSSVFPAFAPAYLALLTLALFGTIALTLLEAYSRVSVGADGVAIRRRFGEHFLAFRDIAHVEEVDGVAIRFFLHSGEHIDLYTGKDEQAGKPVYVASCEKLLARIKAGVAKARAERGDSEAVDNEDLRARAHRVLRGEKKAETAPYRRHPAPAADELIGIVGSSNAAPATRGAAAVLLAQDKSDEGKTKLRIAADAAAHPKLQKLLRLASEDTEAAELDAALAEVEEEKPRATI